VARDARVDRLTEALTRLAEAQARTEALDLAAQLPGTPVVVLFGFVIHPSAREAAARLGAIVISSSGR